MSSLKEYTESEILDRIAQWLPSNAQLICGAGDDTAVVQLCEGADDYLLTSDAVIEGVHFEPMEDLKRVGNKAAGRVLSDIAAMGGAALFLMVDLVIPAERSLEDIEQLYEGLNAQLNPFGAIIVGGDISNSAPFQVHVFAVGKLPKGTAVLRSTAKVKDQLFVTGSLGGSIAAKHLDFSPRIKEGRFLRDWATSMIDLSDGLAKDLRHILSQSDVGAVIQEQAIPVSAGLEEEPLAHALFDGEDYELLFTVKPADVDAFIKAWSEAFVDPAVHIGEIREVSEELLLQKKDGQTCKIEGEGYSHF